MVSTDEPARRSGRATKGQYTKDRDISEDLPATKKKGKGKNNKAKATEQEPEEEEEDENIRCVCGEYDPEEEGRAMICCDECEAWQHNDCMGLADDYAPDKYFCEIHAPQDHKELLAAMARGERPWEVNRKRMAQPKKKPGKKGRKSGARVSEVPSHASQEVAEVRVESPSRGGQNKRKLEESPMAPEMKVRVFESCHPHSLTKSQDVKKARATPTEPDTKPARQRKSMSMATPARSMSISGVNLEMAPKDVEEIGNAARKGTAAGLIKMFIAETRDAVKSGSHTLPVGVSAESAGTQLALRVEYALYMIKSPGTAAPNEAYKDQVKLLLPNVKRNHELRDKILSGEVSEVQLATMAAAEMASEEQQLKDAEIIKKSEKQHTIIEEQGPRIRRTHKGEEFVNEADQIAAESTENRASKPKRRESGIDQDGDTSMNDPDVLSPRETDTRLPPLPGGRSGPPQRQSSSNFDISNVWETVTVQGSPDTSNQQFPELPQQREPGGPVQEPAGPGVGDDADIDRLLKDEDAESEPYSPKDTADGESIIWSGIINGNALGRFHAKAKYAAGATPDALHLTWQSLIPRELPISGRIEPNKANDYLCGLQYSTTSDVIVVTVSQPDTGNFQDLLEFDKIFKYFKERRRYGVITQQAEPAIKDIYLIPLDAGDELPEMLRLLEEKSIGDEHGRITERMLMIPIVIKNTELPHLNIGAMPPTPAMQQTPITPAYENQTFNHLVSPSPYPQHPANGTPANNYYPNPQYAPTQALNPAFNQGPPPSPSPLAVQVLGYQLAHAPAVMELLRRVPSVDAPQLEILAEICRVNGQAALDLGVLTHELQARGEQSAGAGGRATV
jgi:hypothetical protein